MSVIGGRKKNGKQYSILFLVANNTINSISSSHFSSFIMVIKVSIVQFGLNHFKIGRAHNAQVRFEVTSMISDQNFTTRSSITFL